MGWVVAGYELLGPTISGCVEAVFVGAGKQKTNAIVGNCTAAALLEFCTCLLDWAGRGCAGLIGAYVFGLPLAVLLCFGLDGGVQGMWWGLDCGQLARLLLMLQRRSKLDLVAASELAQRRARARK